MTEEAHGAAGRLNSFDEWEQSLRNFDWLHDAISGASDLDLWAERHGQFLVIEGKRWFNGVSVPLGQHIGLLQMAKLAPFTVWLLGETDDADEWYVMPFIGSSGRAIAPLMSHKGKAFYPSVLFKRCTRDDVRAMARAWWEAA